MLKSFKLMAAALSALFSLSSLAHAQTSDAKFSVDEAAYCSASYAWILEILGETLSQETYVQTNIAFMMWNYELEDALGPVTDAEYKEQTTIALNKLAQNIPQVDKSQEGFMKIVEFVTKEASDCGTKLGEQYPKGEVHPVIASLQKKADDAIAAKKALEGTP